MGEVRGLEGRGGGDGALEGRVGGEQVLRLGLRCSRLDRTGCEAERKCMRFGFS